MAIFTFGNISTVVAILYLAHTIFSLSIFWRIESCNHKTAQINTCFKPLGIETFKVEIKASPFSQREVGQPTILEKSFNRNKDWEEDVTFPLFDQTINNGSLYLIIKIYPVIVSSVSDQNSPRSEHINKFTSKISDYRIPSRLSNLVDDNKNKEKIYSSDGILPVTHITSTFTLTGPTDLVSLPISNWPNELRNVKFINFGKYKQSYIPNIELDLMNKRHEYGRELLPINTTTTVKIKYVPRSVGTFRFMKTMSMNFDQLKLQYGFQDKDIDELKSLLADTSIKLLCLTLFVSTFHLLFDILAFKADIQHWRGRDTFVGISTRSVIWRAFSTIVIFAHLYGEDSSYLILIPMGVSCFIETWKVTKACHFSFKLKFWEKEVSSAVLEKESLTAEYDAESIKYLSYILWPLCISGAIYSLIYLEHKSWLQWVLSSIVNGVYAFGFIFMLPQLFINYRLKSVAHLPWKAFMYKSFNTFIDDIFAFLIKMPTSHRLACFRDDIVFFCYLYQRYLYPVDKKRINEYGQTGDVEEKPKSKDSEVSKSTKVSDQNVCTDNTDDTETKKTK